MADENINILSVEERLKKLKSKYVILGLYFYDKTVIEKVKSLKANLLGRKFTDLDTRKYKNLLQASNFIETI